MTINYDKAKEMFISYAHGNIRNEVPNILIEGKVVERVDHAKLLDRITNKLPELEYKQVLSIPVKLPRRSVLPCGIYKTFYGSCVGGVS